MATVERDPERGRATAAKLRALGAKRILITAAEQGYIARGLALRRRELSRNDVLVEPKGVVRVVFAFELGEAVVVVTVCRSDSAPVIVVEIVDVGAIGHVGPKRFVGLPCPPDRGVGFGWVAPLREDDAVVPGLAVREGGCGRIDAYRFSMEVFYD
jgi:hypothetical protein